MVNNSWMIQEYIPFYVLYVSTCSGYIKFKYIKSQITPFVIRLILSCLWYLFRTGICSFLFLDGFWEGLFQTLQTRFHHSPLVLKLSIYST